MTDFSFFFSLFTGRVMMMTPSFIFLVPLFIVVCFILPSLSLAVVWLLVGNDVADFVLHSRSRFAHFHYHRSHHLTLMLSSSPYLFQQLLAFGSSFGRLALQRRAVRNWHSFVVYRAQQQQLTLERLRLFRFSVLVCLPSRLFDDA